MGIAGRSNTVDAKMKCIRAMGMNNGRVDKCGFTYRLLRGGVPSCYFTMSCASSNSAFGVASCNGNFNINVDLSNTGGVTTSNSACTRVLTGCCPKAGLSWRFLVHRVLCVLSEKAFWVTVLMANNTKFVNARAYVRLVGTKCRPVIISGCCGTDPGTLRHIRRVIKGGIGFCRYSIHSGGGLSSMFGRGGVSTIVRFTNLGTMNRSYRGPLRCCSGGVNKALTLYRIVESGNYGGVMFSSSTAICNVGGISPLARSVGANNAAGPCNEQ